MEINEMTDEDLNLHFGGGLVTEFFVTPYQGDYIEISKDDPNQWVCPNCMDLDKPLRKWESNDGGFHMSCDKDHELCEYTYSNRQGRINQKTFLAYGWKNPLTEMQVIQFRISQVRERDQHLTDVIRTTYEHQRINSEQLKSLNKRLRTTQRKLTSCNITDNP